MQTLFPDPHRGLDMDAVHHKQKRPAAVSGCGRRCSLPVTVKASGILGKVLDIVGERDHHSVLGDLGPVSDPKSPYLPVPQFPPMQHGIEDGAHLIRVG